MWIQDPACFGSWILASTPSTYDQSTQPHYGGHGHGYGRGRVTFHMVGSSAPRGPGSTWEQEPVALLGDESSRLGGRPEASVRAG